MTPVWEAIIGGNFFKTALYQLINAGMPANYLAYLFLLPLLVSLISTGRHIIGLTTPGSFLPSIFALIWLELGLVNGLLLAVFLFLWAHLLRFIIRKTMIKKFRIDYMPRMAILLLSITAGILFLILFVNVGEFFKIKENFFPLLVLIVMIQNLIEAEMTLSEKEAQVLVLETTVFAIIGYFVLSWPTLQLLVLTHPGWSLLAILLLNIFVGRYTGFRLLEYRRFKPIVKNS